MRQCEPHDKLMVSLLTYYSELAEAGVKMQNRYTQALYLSAGYGDYKSFNKAGIN